MLYRNRILILKRSRRDLQNGNARTFQENLSLQVLGGSRALVEQLLAEARKLACPRTPGVSIMTARYESWETTSWQPRRPLESLVLADGTLEDLLDDLRDVLRLAVVVRPAGHPPSSGLPAARAAGQRQDDPGAGRGRRAEPVGGRAQPEQPAALRRRPAEPGRFPAAGDPAADRGRRLRVQDRADDDRPDGGHLERAAQRPGRRQLARGPGAVPDDQSPRSPRPRA